MKNGESDRDARLRPASMSYTDCEVYATPGGEQRCSGIEAVGVGSSLNRLSC